jgi:hypothetical protein
MCLNINISMKCSKYLGSVVVCCYTEFDDNSKMFLHLGLFLRIVTDEEWIQNNIMTEMCNSEAIYKPCSLSGDSRSMQKKFKIPQLACTSDIALSNHKPIAPKDCIESAQCQM